MYDFGFHDLFTDIEKKENILEIDKKEINLEAVCICYFGGAESFIRVKYTIIWVRISENKGSQMCEPSAY